MQLAVAGISHNKAPQDVREKASFTKRRAVEGMNTLLGETQIEEAMILSTCNRSEIYAISEEPGEAAEILSDFYVRQAPELADYLYWKTGDEAVRHLFRVASGFDSMILGEDQILGQTQQALALSASAGASGKYLNKIVREAVTYAKKTKAKYSVSESPRSLSATAVKQIMRMVPDYADKRVLIIGSGKMGLLALRYMAEEGFTDVTMTNRTYHPGDEYQTIYRSLNVIPYDDRYDFVKDTDIVISATASPHLVLKRSLMPRRRKPLLIADLGMPRDVDTELADDEEITLLSIDDFTQLFDESDRRLKEVARLAEKEIREEAEAVESWIAKTRTDGLTGRLMNQAREHADETIEILNSRYQFTGRDREFLEKIVHSQFRQMVMPAVLGLRTIDDTEQIGTIEDAAAILTACAREKSE